MMNEESVLKICTDENNYITSIISDEESRKTLPEDMFEPGKMRFYKYINEEFIFDEDAYNEMIESSIKYRKRKEIKEQIDILKTELNESDYKIIKCYDYSLSGRTPDYDIEELCNQRQSIRDEINRLEKILEET